MKQTVLELDFPEAVITYPIGRSKPRHLRKIARDLLPVCDVLAEKGTAIAASFGKTVSCKKGCSYCCNQMVPLSPPEALIIADVVEHLPQDRKRGVLISFEKARNKLAAAGLWDALSDIYRDLTDRKEVMAINRKYYELAIPCPFLLEGSCGIYADRPSRCREFSALSPAEYCADAFDERIRRLPLTIRLCESLSYGWASVTATPPVIVPLVKALDWVRDNPVSRDLRIDNGDVFAKAVLEFACKKANARAQERMRR